MQFELSKEHKMLQKAVREFADNKIAPNADQWDADNYLPVKEAIRPMAELGFIGTVIPQEYGGEDAGWMAAAIITEEIARASSSLRVQINLIGQYLQAHYRHGSSGIPESQPIVSKGVTCVLEGECQELQNNEMVRKAYVGA